jgi:hypothetical protein
VNFGSGLALIGNDGPDFVAPRNFRLVFAALLRASTRSNGGLQFVHQKGHAVLSNSSMYFQAVALLVTTIVAAPALGQNTSGVNTSGVSECTSSPSPDIAQPPEVSRKASPLSPLQPVVGVFPTMRTSKSLSAAEERALQPKDLFKECEICPEMVVVPAGEFTMGSPELEQSSDSDERPQHRVVFANRLAVSRFAVTFAEGMLASLKAVASVIVRTIAVGGAVVSQLSIYGGRMPRRIWHGFPKGLAAHIGF